MGSGAKSYMRKGFLMRKWANISPHMRMPLVTYDFAPDPSVSLYMRKILFYFLSVWYTAHCTSTCYFLAVRILKLYASVILQISIKVNVRCIIYIISALGWLGWEGLLAMSLKEKPPLGFMGRQLNLKSEVRNFIMLYIQYVFPSSFLCTVQPCK